MMDLRKRIIAVVGLGVGAIVIGVGISTLVLRRVTPVSPARFPASAGGTGTSSSTGSGQGATLVVQTTTPPDPTKTTSTTNPLGGAVKPASQTVIKPLRDQLPLPTEAELSSLAFTFTETFGSYSNQGGFENLERLRFLMTRAMNQWVDELVAKRANQPAPERPDLYYGITTHALSSRVSSADPGGKRMTIVVRTQRSEVRGIASNADRTIQDLSVEFLKEDNLWKVQSATWGAKQGSSSAISTP